MRRLFAITLALFVAACGKTPSAPSSEPASPPPAPVTFADFSGLWTAKYRITACEWERHCVLYMGEQREFNLRLVQSGSHVRGLFVDGLSAADVEGDVSSDGTLVMSGYRPPASSRDGSFRVTEIRIRRGTSPDLEGQIGYEARLAPQYSEVGLGMKLSGQIVTAARSDLSMFASSMDGTYRGTFAVRSCVTPGVDCYPAGLDEVMDLSLTVTTTGGEVSAIYQQSGTRVALTGTLSGRTLLLAGESTAGTPGFEYLNRVTNWRTSIDEFGRISGTFHFDLLYPIVKPNFGGSVDCELVQLVKTVQ